MYLSASCSVNFYKFFGSACISPDLLLKDFYLKDFSFCSYSIILFPFFQYEEKGREQYFLVNNNYYYLFQIAEQVKKRFLGTVLLHAWGNPTLCEEKIPNNSMSYVDPSGHVQRAYGGVRTTNLAHETVTAGEGRRAEDNKSGRNSLGVVTGSENGDVSRMMRGKQGNIGLIPQEVANSGYAKEFSPSNIGRMQKGLAPRVLSTQQYGGALSYVLHHKKPNL